ncbi:ATP synthase subunit I [Niveispirillum lacus]|nr:ATP synthase subunit I [Niveispirillum lacus]
MMTETWITAGLALLAGAGGAWLFFRMLALNTRFYASGRAVAAVILHAGRLSITAALLIFVARLGGAVPLLAVIGGFLLMRPLLLRQYRRG